MAKKKKKTVKKKTSATKKKNSIKNFNYLTESDKKIINKMLSKKTIKDIVDYFKDRNIPKRTIYNYCLEKKNEN